MLPIDSIFNEITEEEVFETSKDLAEALGLKPDTWFTFHLVGGLARLSARGVSKVWNAYARFVRSRFLDTAEGLELKIKAQVDYNYIADEATFATGFLKLTNTGGGLFNKDAEKVTFTNAVTQKRYRNTEKFTLQPVGQLGSVITIPIRAEEEGAASTAAPGEISVAVASLPGVNVTNEAIVLGLDAESEDSIKAGCREKLSGLGKGSPRDAYKVAARKAKRLDGSPVNINRAIAVPNLGTGVVEIWVASPSGAVIPDDVTASQANVDDTALVLCSSAPVASCPVKVIAVSYRAVVDAAALVSAPAVQARIAAALAVLFRTYYIGGVAEVEGDPGYFWLDQLASNIDNADKAIVRVEILAPLAPVPLAYNEVPALGAVTPNVVIVRQQ